MKPLYEWARAWGVSVHAVRDLERRLNVRLDTAPAEAGRSEANVQSRVRLEAAGKRMHLWRNNVGATPASCPHCNEALRPVRYGLANDSAKMNKVIKSSDLIGIRSVLITPDLIGFRIGQFVAREAKPEGWFYTGTEHEVAQRRFIELVVANGGDAAFTSGEGSL